MSILRNELKYYISSAHAVLLEKRLSAVLWMDSHTSKNGFYCIRSLYFDDPTSGAFLNKINGLEKREKYRIRYYNNDLGFLRLEKKEKIGNKCRKTYLPISYAFADSLLNGCPCASEAAHPLLDEIAFRVRNERFRPVVFVDYLRKAFLYPAGNVRITLDSQLTSSRFSSTLEDKKCSVPVLSPGETILEVKFDSFLPPMISALLEDIPKVNSSISKYCKCYEAVY